MNWDPFLLTLGLAVLILTKTSDASEEFQVWSCKGRCFAEWPFIVPVHRLYVHHCFCDMACILHNDCCLDWPLCLKVPGNSCKGRCGSRSDQTHHCHCNVWCGRTKAFPCCQDFAHDCVGQTGGEPRLHSRIEQNKYVLTCIADPALQTASGKKFLFSVNGLTVRNSPDNVFRVSVSHLSRLGDRFHCQVSVDDLVSDPSKTITLRGTGRGRKSVAKKRMALY